MTIADAIRWLEALQKQHGPSTIVYFDCPDCQRAFTPSTVVAQTVHLKAEKTP